jgi:hypothetical protein
MSTRCQVVIQGEGYDTESLTMYHHCDGYPSYMIPLLQKAAKILLKESGTVKYNSVDSPAYDITSMPWEAGRVSKVASCLCAADPLGFEPEKTNDLHSDIEYLYELIVSGEGHCVARVQWSVTVFTPNSGFWDNPCKPNMTTVLFRTPLHKVNGKKLEKLINQQ